MSPSAKRVVGVDRERQPYRTELTPVSFLRRSAYVFPDRIAVIHGTRRYTYRQFEERANRLASHLRALGLRHLDRVAVIAPNTPAMLEAHFGVPAAGLVLVPINTRLNADEIGYILEHSGAKVLFVDREFEAVLRSAPAGLRVVRIDDTGAPGDPYEDFLAAGSPDPCEPWLEDEYETISINYTSGTTGPAERRHGPSPGRLPERHRRDPGDRPLVRRPVPVDPADVPLQRLVLHVGGHRVRRDPRVPPAGRARPGVGPDRRRGRHPLLRRADGADRDRQRPQGPRARPAR